MTGCYDDTATMYNIHDDVVVSGLRPKVRACD
jgi:hypothetical protein